MANLRCQGSISYRPWGLVTACAHFLLSETVLNSVRERSHLLHQKDIDWRRPARNHRRNQPITELSRMKVLLVIAFATCLLVLEKAALFAETFMEGSHTGFQVLVEQKDKPAALTE
jgi:hypothetical protein